MDDAVFAPGTPEAEIAKADGMPVYVEGEKNAMGDLRLTNDRLLFVDNKVSSTTGNIVGDLIASAINEGARSKQENNGVQDLILLSELRGAYTQQRRMIPDLYVLVRGDGKKVRTHRKLKKKWDAQLRRLVTERHGGSVIEDGDGWRTS